MTEPSQQRMAVNGFFGKFASFVARIPYRYITNLGRILGMLVYLISARHRWIVGRNLEFVYPEWTHQRIKKMSKRVFQNIGISFTEICQLHCLAREDILNRVQIEGENNLQQALEKQNGAVMISGHMGNWELLLLFCPLYFKTGITFVAKQSSNNTISRWVHGLRTRFGSKVIYKEGAWPEMTRTLRQGKMVGVLIDQKTESSIGAKITFFNKYVTATPVAALLALRCQSPVLPAFCIRDGDGSYTIKIYPPVTLKKTDDFRSDLRTNTQIMTDAIEIAISEYPEQWFWVLKRWKKYYPDLYRRAR
ncbi:MAG: hypothetical protein JSV38_02545 [Desulfobacterales bacterium]|nr:MAG: hypothetical protein JSV38_02545 [Desulfobacterales bacterium]